jgi:hypothetical protein
VSDSIREQITAAICEVIHPQPSPDNDRAHCQTATKAADAVLIAISEEFLSDGAVPPGEVIPIRRDTSDNLSWLQGWDQCRTAVLILLGIDDPAVTR